VLGRVRTFALLTTLAAILLTHGVYVDHYEELLHAGSVRRLLLARSLRTLALRPKRKGRGPRPG
jgi:hypothetical protein